MNNLPTAITRPSLWLSLLFALFFTELTQAQRAAIIKPQLEDAAPYLENCLTFDHYTREQCSYDKLVTFIQKNIEYPDQIQEDRSKSTILNNEGTVIVAFSISRQGKMEDIHIVQSITPPLDAEVLRVMQLAKNEFSWIPAIEKGELAGYTLQIPVKFEFKSQ